MRRLWRWVRTLAVLGVVVFAVTAIAVQIQSARMLAAHLEGRSLAEPVDAIIVLGASIDGNAVIAPSSRRRVEAAAVAFRAGKARVLIFSGGLGFNHPDKSAGEIMRDYALRLGIPEEATRVEGRSLTTFENLRFSFALAEAEGLTRLALASDAYHLTRARALAAYFGQPDIALVAADGADAEPFDRRAWTATREPLAWWLNLAKIAGWEGLGLIGYSEAERAELIR